MPRASESASGRPLNGWKEIAAYLGKSVRSVQRWEATLGLPVHRIKTPDGQIVYAEAAEIDTWRQALDVAPVHEPVDRSGPEPYSEARPQAIKPTTAVDRVEKSPFPRRSRALLIAAGVVILVAGIASARRQANQSSVPVDIRLSDHALEALSADGNVLWTHTFDREGDVTPPIPRPSFKFVDVDGDNETEILAFVRFAQKGRPDTVTDGLFCFGRKGNLRWSVIPAHALSLGDQGYGAR